MTTEARASTVSKANANGQISPDLAAIYIYVAQFCYLDFVQQ